MPQTIEPKNPPTSWHSLSHSEALEKLESSTEGISSDQAARRLEIHGPNVLEHAAKESILVMLWRQINNPLIWVLIASGCIAVAVGKVTDGLVVLTVVVLNSIIGFVQEFKAGKAIDALRSMVPEFANTMRDGHLSVVPVSQLVPGDVVALAAGDKVPADVRLLAVKNLRVEEAALTGESVPVQKSVAAVADDASLGDRTSLAFKGTLVTAGTASALVVVTGSRTELGRISKMIEEATALITPLTKALESLAKIITIAIIAVSAVILAFGVYRALSEGVELGNALKDTLIFAIALAVGAIPEGLPAIVTIALAIGVQRMASRRAIVRQLPAVETLGSTTIICSDKTGTLTRNEMTVHALWTPSDGKVSVDGVGYDPKGSFTLPNGKHTVTPSIKRLLENVALCNDSTLDSVDDAWSITGDPTEGALVVAAEKAGIEVNLLRRRAKRKDVVPFESEHQYMATLNADEWTTRIIVKGAPEVVARFCATDDGPPLDLGPQINNLAALGMRVLGVAEKKCSDDTSEISADDVNCGFSFCGLVGMIDPPRPEVIEAVKACHSAGIQVKMITGDHEVTANAIGVQLGLSDDVNTVQGKVLPTLSERELQKVIEETEVFARVAPEHKLLIVRSLQKNGHIVAMTGDGVNDAPALKQSNIGVAMGITGTSVSKESADIVLTDDNFATIVAAVEEGRRVYDNLIKSLAFVIPTNLGLAFILMYAVLFLPYDRTTHELLLPVQPTQILWINLIAAVALALPLALEANEPNSMGRPPRNPAEPVMNPLVIRRTVLASILMTIGSVGLFLLVRGKYFGETIGTDDPLAEAQTMAVTTVIFFQAFYLLNCRSLRDSVFKIGFFSNPYVFLGIGVTFALQAAFIYAPPFQRVFGTAPLDPAEVGLSLLAGVATLPIITLEKWISRKYQEKHNAKIREKRT
ncbi:MAG: HAD-IC family P-type ATPase [Polyangiaceae bacterium]|nr:HAD-IC family P-type ATPase [Polyangiaceae bacterium]